jgi:hypothetical protein
MCVASTNTDASEMIVTAIHISPRRSVTRRLMVV